MKAAANYIRGLLESGAFKPVIDRRYSSNEIVDAYRYAETGQKIGNVVISVADRGDQLPGAREIPANR